MTSEEDIPRELTPGEEESVRRLLAAGAAEPEPLPPHVADRLDDALADLVAERDQEQAASAGGAPVGTLRRRWPALLAAAAVVSVVAVGVGNLVGSGGSGVSSSESVAGRATAGSPGPASTPYAGGALPVLHKGTFGKDAQKAANAQFGRSAAAPDTPGQQKQLGNALRLPSLGACALPPHLAVRDRALLVLLDGQQATLVFRAPVSGTREAQVYSCHNPHKPLRHTRIVVR